MLQASKPSNVCDVVLHSYGARHRSRLPIPNAGDRNAVVAGQAGTERVVEIHSAATFHGW